MNNLSNPNHDTEKVPDWILLREANKEIGKLNSYIQELEESINKLKKISRTERLRLRLDEIFLEQRKEIHKLQTKVHSQKITIENLINKYSIIK
jgi:hypothetical protein